MKLVDVKCQNDYCGFDKWEMEFDHPYHVASERCPNCDMVNVVTMDIKLMGEYNEDKEDR